jgi:hypothetical protein
MSGMIARFVGTILTLGALAGCCSSSGTEETLSVPAALFDATKEVVAARREGPAAVVTPTGEVLAGINEPVLQINPEKAGGSDFLRRAATRNDSGLGTVEVWNSSVKALVFLRNGVLIGTRGVGGDIIAADANVTIRALAARKNSSGLRNYTISDGDVTTTDYQFRCEIRNLGPAKINVAYQIFETVQMQEDCVGGPQGDAMITNTYWVQQSSGLIRKSRQWVGPRVGYFELIVLKN